jgi:Spy/CpxP family protein refolding chaperone
MHKTTHWMVVIVLTLSMSFSLAAYSGGGPDVGKYMRHRLRTAEKILFPVRLLLEYRNEISLTQNQIDRIEKLQVARQEQIIQEKADIRVLELKFSNYMKGDQIDRSQVEKMARMIGQKKTDMHVKNLHHLLDVKEVLTPEQIAKIEELKNEWRKKRMENFERRRRTPRRRT